MSLEFRYERQLELLRKDNRVNNWEILEYNGYDNVVCKCKICGEIVIKSKSDLVKGKMHKKCSYKFRNNYNGFANNSEGNINNILKFTDICKKIDNPYSEFIKYLKSSEVWCRCKLCDEVYKTTFDSFKKNTIHKPCMKLAHNWIRMSDEEFKQTVSELYSDIVCISEYEGMYNKVRLKCNICGEEWECAASKVINIGVRCPNCQKLAGEEAVGNILKSMNIAFEREKEFEGCKNIRNLKFDYYLPEYNICIEYNGEQHYKDGTLFNDDEKNTLEYSKKRDNIKREFCENNGIKLLEIRFNEFRYIKRILKKAILNP